MCFLDRPTSLLKENWGFTDILKHTWDLVYYNNYGGMKIFSGRSWKLWQIQKGQMTHLCTFNCHFISDSGGILFCVFCFVFFYAEFLSVCTVILELKSAHHEYTDLSKQVQRFRLDQQAYHNEQS